MKARKFFTATITTNAVAFWTLWTSFMILALLSMTKQKVSYQCTVQYDSLHTQVVTIRNADRMPRISLDGRTGKYVECKELK